MPQRHVPQGVVPGGFDLRHAVSTVYWLVRSRRARRSCVGVGMDGSCFFGRAGCVCVCVCHGRGLASLTAMGQLPSTRPP